MTKEINKKLITENEVSDLEKIMNLKYGAYLKNRFFQIAHEESPSEISCSITLRDSSQSFYYNVEAFVKQKNLPLENKKALFIMLDYIDVYFDEYLRGEEDVYIPIDWVDYTFENLTFKMRGQVKNMKAETLADEILQKNAVQLEG